MFEDQIKVGNRVTIADSNPNVIFKITEVNLDRRIFFMVQEGFENGQLLVTFEKIPDLILVQQVVSNLTCILPPNITIKPSKKKSRLSFI